MMKINVWLLRVLTLCFCFFDVATLNYDYEITVTNEKDTDTYDCVTSGSASCNLRGAINAANLYQPHPVLITFDNNVSDITMNLTEFGSLIIHAATFVDICGPSNREGPDYRHINCANHMSQGTHRPEKSRKE